VPFTALFINTPASQWQPAHWGLMLARWPSALIGTVTIPLIYAVGSQLNGQRSISNSPTLHLPSSIALLAAGLFAFSPEGVVWGGRGRMYALATLLVLLCIFWAYRGAIYPALARYRWWAMLALLAALLTQLGAIILIPPLIISMVIAGWLSYSATQGNDETVEKPTNHASRLTPHPSPPWFLRPGIIREVLALALVVGIALWVKRLGQPLGAAALGSDGSDALPTELLDTVTYQTTLHFSWPDTIDFLAEQFGPPHLFWITIATLIATILGLAILLTNHWRMSGWQTGDNVGQSNKRQRPVSRYFRVLASSAPAFTLFLWLIFGLILVEMVTLLDPFRRNPRYLVMFLPLFYLIAANAVLRMAYYVLRVISPVVMALICLIGFTLLGLDDLRIALVTPEPAYEEAFEFIQQNWQPGDALLTMNTPAAGLYLGQADGFTVQEDAGQFLLNRQSAPVDRWLGAPWLGTSADLNAALNAHERVWFVIDTIRQPVYFRGDWQAVVNSQMEQVWNQDNALIYRTRPDRTPLPTQPDKLVNTTLGESIELVGYSLQIPNTPSLAFDPNERISNLQSPGEASNLRLTLFWRALRPLTTDYTVFIHLRNHEGVTIAQQDGLSLDGAYPTSRWQPEEMMTDPFILTLPANLPAGRYTLWAGLYDLDTLERLPVANDTSGENAVLLGEINISE
jgi:hypothetical protein